MRFDDAIGSAISVIREQCGKHNTPITFVREVAGQLTAIIDDDAIAPDKVEELAVKLDKRLGRFSPGPRRVLLLRSDLIAEQDVLDSPDRIPLADTDQVWLVDRLLTNQDWLHKPILVNAPLPVATAYSLKGGVGRSTAVAVWSWYLARQGRRVVAVDLDLEAPGLGSLLVGDLPAYGAVDWLVEALLQSPGQDLLDDCLTLSPISEDLEGIVQVLPAFGEATRDYVAKVGRAYAPSLTLAGNDASLAARLEHLLAALAQRQDPPDIVLLDSRAGLHDIGAAAVTQLGAETFLFARDEVQSWRAYRLLLEHLARSKAVHFGMPDDDLRWRLKMVAAQVDKTEGAVQSWRDSSYEAWTVLYDEERNPPDEAVAATFIRDDPDAPHNPLTIYYDGGIRHLNLLEPSQRPPWQVIEAAFGEFLAGATARLFPTGELGTAHLER